MAGFWAPSVSQAAADIEAMQNVLAAVEPELERSLLGPARSGDGKNVAPAHAFISRLLDPGAAAGTGVRADGPLVIYFDADASVAVLGLELSDRPDFERWLKSIAGDGERRVAIGGEQAAVLGAADGVPLACVSRVSHAYCQIGVSPGDKPLALLSDTLEVHGAKTHAASSSLLRALDALPKDASWYGVFDPAQIVEHGARRRGELVRQEYRFDEGPVKKAAEERLRGEESRARAFARTFDGGALAVSRGPNGLLTTIELGLAPNGQKLVQLLAPGRAPSSVLSRWAKTPALIHGFIQVHPQRMATFLRRFGAELPVEALDGTGALLVLGVDCECDVAKRGAPHGPLDWAFLFPSAFAMGLAKDKGRANLPAEYRSPEGAAGQWSLERKTASGNYQVHVLDEALVFGAGPGSGSAALRRFASLPASDIDPIPEARVDLEVHLKAIDAAFTAASLGLEHRAELLLLEAVRMKMKPLFERMDQIHLSARPSGGGKRVRIEMRTGH